MLSNKELTPLTSVAYNTKVSFMLYVYLGFIVALLHVVFNLGCGMMKQILEQL